MPQITSCPECGKKLRVPDELIGKKVKCPGCTTMFIAEADDQEEAAPPPKKAPPKPPPLKVAPKAAPERTRPDAVTASPRSKKREVEDEDEEEAPRPRGRDRDDDGEEDRPSRGRGEVAEERRPRARRDEEEEDRRPRRGRDDEEDDRPSRRRRDEDEDDDDDDRPRSRRRDYDEDTPAQQRRGWAKARTGINLTAMAGWTYLGTVGVVILGVGIMLLMGGNMIASIIGSIAGGNPNNAAGTAAGGAWGMLGGAIVFILVIGLFGLVELVLRLVGMGLCMAVPKVRGSSMKGLAIAAFCCAAGAVLLSFTGNLVGGFSAGGLAGFSGGGNSFGYLSSVAGLIGHILWVIMLRMACNELGDRELGGRILTVLIVQIVYGFVALIVLVIMFFILGASVISGVSDQTGGGGSTIGAGLVVTAILGVLLAIGYFCIFGWYVMTLQKIRDLVEYRGSEG